MSENKKGLSIQAKVIATLVLVFTFMMAATTWYAGYAERWLVQKVITQATLESADTYLDGLNIMMLTGTMNNREVLREKIMSRPEIIEARAMRGKEITKVFGPGEPDEAPRDELDHDALGGKTITQITEVNDHRTLTVVKPVIASSNYRGTNCLMCHQVEEGTVLGAIRISYSLNEIDKEINTTLLYSGVINIILFTVGLALLWFVMQKVVHNPIRRLSETFEIIERDADLTQRVKHHSNDELGKLADSANKMLSHFADSMQQVCDTTHKVAHSAQNIAQVSEHAAATAEQQNQRCTSAAMEMEQMQASTEQVQSNSMRTVEASQQANHEAQEGVEAATQAIDSINRLANEIRQGAMVIATLDEKSNSVGSVLDVIKGIAEQTNLLALNAAIEAARAGESGRGFAVVADEVRTLAIKTQDSTQEIEKMIAQLQTEAQAAVQQMESAQATAEDSVQQVQNTVSTLDAIAQKIAGINDLNSHVAELTAQQSESAKTINQSVHAVNELAANTSSNANETASISESLVELSTQLRNLIDRFKL